MIIVSAVHWQWRYHSFQLCHGYFHDTAQVGEFCSELNNEIYGKFSIMAQSSSSVIAILWVFSSVTDYLPNEAFQQHISRA